MADTSIASEFRDACAGTRQCPFCVLRTRQIVRYLRSFLYEYVNDRKVNEQLWRSYGYCHEHAWHLYRQDWTAATDATGVAIVHERILGGWELKLDALCAEPASGRVRRGIEGLFRREQSAGARAAEAIKAEEGCPACVHAEQAERFAVAEIADELQRGGDGWPWSSLSASAGLCLSHLRSLLRLMHSDVAVRHLLLVQKQRIAELRAHLNEFVRKHDYRYQHEVYSESEQTSWRDAIALLAGECDIGGQ